LTVEHFLERCAVVIVLASLAFAQALAQSGSPQKLPKPQELDRDVQYIRDPASGEIRTLTKGATPTPTVPRKDPAAPYTFRSQVTLIAAACSAVANGGVPLSGLTISDFQLAADGVPQRLSHLDASTEPAHIGLILDASPSEARSIEEMKAAASALSAELSPQDEVAVVSFAGHTHLLLPFSADRQLMEKALSQVDLMRSLDETGSNIYSSVYLAALKLFSGSHAPGGRKAIILLTDGQDSGLKLTWDPASMYPPEAGGDWLTFEDMVRQLSSAGVEVFAISTESRPDRMTADWLSAQRGATLISRQSRRIGVPAYTIYLAELVRRVGGDLYFLREIGTLGDAYRRIAARLRTEYLLGFYPDDAAARAGWHNLEVDFSDAAAHRGAHLDCRPSYYVPATH
jgi:VWFA-related protein